MSEPVIRVENLSKVYNISHKGERPDTLRDAVVGLCRRKSKMESFHALKDVSFEVKQGEVLGIIGHNGAGKSTLLKILSRITEPTSGRVEIRGRVASLLEVGTGFHPELSGRENIFLNGAILGMRRSEIRMKFDEIIEFSGIEKFLDTPVKRYSSGMYVRLAFAVAAHLEPEILIVDEVLAVGDLEFQKKCLGKMKDVAGHGRTVLFVSHNMTSVRSMCSRAIVLNKGNVLKDLDAERSINYYAELVSGICQQDLLSKLPISFIYDLKLPNNLKTGGEFSLELTLKPDENSPPEIDVSVTFRDSMGNRVLQIYSEFSGETILLRNRAKVVVKILLESLPLVPGRYMCNLWLGYKRTTVHMFEDAFALDVGSKNEDSSIFHQTGYSVYAQASWQTIESWR